jgi:hypothetical protein
MSWHTLGDVIDVVYSALVPRLGVRAAELATALLVDQLDQPAVWS